MVTDYRDVLNHMIVQLLLYGSGVWGCKNSDIVGKLDLIFLSMLLGVNNKTLKCIERICLNSCNLYNHWITQGLVLY